MLVGLDFLSCDRKQCPQHLSECHKQLHKIMFPPKGKYQHNVPIVIMYVPQSHDQPLLSDILTSMYGPLPPNILILQEASVDSMLIKLVRDLGSEAQVEAIDRSV